MIDEFTFEQIRALLAVGREKSFSRAAEKIFRTQAAVSIQVDRIERIAGMRLFDRSTRSVELTDAGMILFRYFERIERLLAQSVKELADLSGNRSGGLVISASDTIACYYLPEIMRKYRELYPGVNIVVENATSFQTVRKVLDTSVDLGIATIDDLPEELETIPLFPRKDVVICHPGHPLAGKESVFLKDLERYGMILLDRNCATRRLLDRRCERAGARLSVVMELSSVEVIKRFVSIDSGISVVPAMAVSGESGSGILRVLPVDGEENEETVWMGIVYGKNRYLSHAAGSFIALAGRGGVSPD